MQMFIEKYSNIIDILQSKLPGVKIYIQSLGTISDKDISEKKINCYNKVLKQLCLQKQVPYLQGSSFLQTRMKNDEQRHNYYDYNIYQLWCRELSHEIKLVGEIE
ncbi:hypothetical protein [Candidatus Stoquefichus massiliensis]|uniref:hypothetical protein n=1 Tax=Candidatus Stoquefichus massiliensis TaxID=1470350 RepID=UPI0004877654|nr:hypothetical protein [Candidatus Stoquefichus massiliensis]